MKDSDRNLMKDTEKNVVVLSNRTPKYETCENGVFITEEARLGTTPRFLPRQVKDKLQKERKNFSERSTLGSSKTTRLSLRQVVGRSNQGDCNHEAILT